VQLRNAGSTEAIIANVQTNLNGAPRMTTARDRPQWLQGLLLGSFCIGAYRRKTSVRLLNRPHAPRQMLSPAPG